MAERVDLTRFFVSSHFGSQKLKFDIKDKTVVEDNPQLEQEKATLTRISSLLREVIVALPLIHKLTFQFSVILRTHQQRLQKDEGVGRK